MSNLNLNSKIVIPREFEIVLTARCSRIMIFRESFVQDIEIAVRSVHDFSIDDGIVHIDVAEIQSSEDRIANTPHYGAEQFAEITQSV